MIYRLGCSFFVDIDILGPHPDARELDLLDG
jgi:hypothetical protein